MLEVDILADFHHVEPLAVAIDHMLGVEAECETAEVGLGIVAAEDTVLILIAHTRGELAAVRAARYVQSVARGHGILVAQSLQPVGAGVAAVLISGQQVGIDESRPVVHRGIGVERHHVHHLHILAGREQFRHLIDVLPTHITVV